MQSSDLLITLTYVLMTNLGPNVYLTKQKDYDIFNQTKNIVKLIIKYFFFYSNTASKYDIISKQW